MSLFCAFFAAFQKLQKICLLSTVLFSPLCCGLSSRREAELHEGSFTQVSKILAVWLEYQTVQTKSQGSKCVAKESFIGKALPSAISSSASWQRLAPPSWWSRRARWSPSHGWMKDIGRNRYHWLAMMILPNHQELVVILNVLWQQWEIIAWYNHLCIWWYRHGHVG